MLGVILCGGKSSRMGSDKGLLKLEARTWAQTAIDKMSAIGLEVVVSVNESQFEEYGEVIERDKLVKDNKELTINGPLSGLLSVHIQYPLDDLFILACDMLLMESFTLQELFVHSLSNTESDVLLFTNNGEPEPLCAIYRANGLKAILKMHYEGQLIKHSMKFMLEQLKVYAIEIPEDRKKYFSNFNAHAELNGL